MSIKVGINGFGRIGRNVVRACWDERDLEFVAVNDITNAETLAHLLKYDSVHGRFGQQVTAEKDALAIGGRHVRVLSERDPAKLPWKDLGVQVVLECSGLFTSKEKAAVHLAGGAKKVLISAPGKGVDLTLCYGVNHAAYKADQHHVISNASCTTNCLAPVAKVLNDVVGIETGFMTTIHAYTGDQPTLDTLHKDLYRGRAAALSMIPTSTGAAKAIGLVIPELQGKLNGIAVRAPVATGSVVDLVFTASKDTSVEEVNEAVRAAAGGSMEGILQYTEDPIVSTDIVTSQYSSIFDSLLTMVIDNRLVKVVSWYDNEWGYSNRLVDLTQRVLATAPTAA